MRTCRIAVVVSLFVHITMLGAQGEATAQPFSTTRVLPQLVVTAVAPVFLKPDATLTPLRMMNVGAALGVLQDAGQWYQVEFEDPQFGRRVGYIQKNYVQASATHTGQREPLASPLQALPGGHPTTVPDRMPAQFEPAPVSSTPRVTIAVGAAAQRKKGSFVDVTNFPYFAETAHLVGDYEVADGIAFDIAGVVRIWRRLALGIGVTRGTRDTQSQTQGSFPHPLYLDADRTGSWTSQTLERVELSTHLSGVLEAVQHPRLGLIVLGGPTWFNFEQGVVDSVEVIQSYPYDTIDARLVPGTLKGSTLGWHVGADVSWFFTRHFGLGGLIRFATATKQDLQIGIGEPFHLELGGFEGGGGVRVRF